METVGLCCEGLWEEKRGGGKVGYGKGERIYGKGRTSHCILPRLLLMPFSDADPSYEVESPSLQVGFFGGGGDGVEDDYGSELCFELVEGRRGGVCLKGFFGCRIRDVRFGVLCG